MDAKVKNKIIEQFIAICHTRSVEKLREILLFRVISRLSGVALAKTDVSRAILLWLAIWIFAVVSVFAESYPNRPTEYEMEWIVTLGGQCVLGVNERCWATQTSTNPTYGVSPPFTNTTGFYLDQDLMGTMASKIRSLAPYYIQNVDIATNITYWS
ncbi:MAG: hypothetical protein V1899_09425, partial [Planctomycetota bacterium]